MIKALRSAWLTIIQDNMGWAQLPSDSLKEWLNLRGFLEIRRQDEVGDSLELFGGMTRNCSDLVASVCEFLGCSNTGVDSSAKLQPGVSDCLKK